MPSGGGGGGFGYVTSPYHSLADVHKGPDIVLQTIRAEQLGYTTFDRIDIVRAAMDGFTKVRVTQGRKPEPNLPGVVRSRHDQEADALIARTRPAPSVPPKGKTKKKKS